MTRSTAYQRAEANGLGKIVRLYKPPNATLTNPHAQIKWIFYQLEAECKEPRAAYVRYAKNKYIEFIEKTNAKYDELISDPRFHLDRYWEADALIRFNSWLNVQKLASKSRYGIYKTVRQVMDMAYALRVIDNIVYHAPMFKGVSETKVRSAYSEEEQQVINAAVSRWMGLTVDVLRGYTPTGLGLPYRKRSMVGSLSLDGQDYSLNELSEKFGIEAQKISRRIRQGCTLQQAVADDIIPRYRSKSWIINGVEYHTLTELATVFGISKPTISSRIAKGWTNEQLVGLAPKPVAIRAQTGAQPDVINVAGESFRSLKEVAQRFGVEYRRLKARVYIGWTLEEAVGLTNHATLGKKIVVEEVEYKNLTTAAKAYGLGHGVVALRLRLGYSPEQAVGVLPLHVLQSDERALLWIFENEYECDAFNMLSDLYPRNLSAVCSEERLRKLFIRWGVWPYVDDRLVMPLAVEFGMLTGLNVEALKLLEIDSLQMEHKLTGQSAISYRKPRSGSATRSEDKDLHIPMLEMEELYLDGEVAKKIYRLYNMIIAITERIRSEAPLNISRRLFIFEDVELSRRLKKKSIVALDPKRKVNTWYGRFCREEGLRGLFGSKFSFNISRCRPTLVTNMVLAGAPLFQVQAVLGHANIETSASYLDDHALRPVFNSTISTALERISARSMKARVVIPIHLAPTDESPSEGDSQFHETLSGCNCTNPYSPSENVKLVTKHKSGSACKFWNMCLLCDNAIITESSLPKLIVYRSRVAMALEGESMPIKARRELFQTVIKLIDGITTVDIIFPEAIITKARYLAASMDDLLVDQLIYQGI